MTCSKGRPLLAWATGASACVLVLLGAGGAVQPGAAQAQEAASAVQDVTLQDVTLTFGDTVLKAPRLTASGTRLSKDELTALLKPGPGESWASRLVRLDAASLAMPELRVERTGTAGATPVVTYRDVVERAVHDRVDRGGARLGSHPESEVLVDVLTQLEHAWPPHQRPRGGGHTGISAEPKLHRQAGGRPQIGNVRLDAVLRLGPREGERANARVRFTGKQQDQPHARRVSDPIEARIRAQ